MSNPQEKPAEEQPKYGSVCGQTHDDCPNSWKGSCDREAGHDSSHHCSSCNSVF